MFEADNFNEIYLELIKDVRRNGELSKPRGMEIKELIGYSFRLTNPRNCLCTLSDRKLNYKFAMIEKLEYLYGVSSKERICHYNKQMSSFANEITNEFDGAYGPRLRSQFDYIIKLLQKDKDSRQAVLNINNVFDKHETKDVPCTIALQVFIRKNKLHMVTYMRSNDLLWGTPYDVNGFCFIQEALAFWLGVELGTYTHIAGSLHLYTEREDKLQFISNKTNNKKNELFDVTRSQFLLSEQDFWNSEERLRKKVDIDISYQNLPLTLKLYLQEIT